MNFIYQLAIIVCLLLSYVLCIYKCQCYFTIILNDNISYLLKKSLYKKLAILDNPYSSNFSDEIDYSSFLLLEGSGRGSLKGGSRYQILL